MILQIPEEWSRQMANERSTTSMATSAPDTAPIPVPPSTPLSVARPIRAPVTAPKSTPTGSEKTNVEKNIFVRRCDQRRYMLRVLPSFKLVACGFDFFFG